MERCGPVGRSRGGLVVPPWLVVLIDTFVSTFGTAQKRLRDLKSRISAQSKKNFVLERDVRYLDGRIALLIQNVSDHPESLHLPSMGRVMC